MMLDLKTYLVLPSGTMTMAHFISNALETEDG